MLHYLVIGSLVFVITVGIMAGIALYVKEKDEDDF